MDKNISPKLVDSFELKSEDYYLFSIRVRTPNSLNRVYVVHYIA